MKIVDSHHHLWDTEWLPYTWTRNRPAFNRSFRLSDYLQAVEPVELEHSVHVEADVDEPYILQETRMILALAEQDNPIQGVVAGCRPEKEGFRAYLDQIAGHPKLKGVRRILHTEPDGVGKSTLFARNVALLAATVCPSTCASWIASCLSPSGWRNSAPESPSSSITAGFRSSARRSWT